MSKARVMSNRDANPAETARRALVTADPTLRKAVDALAVVPVNKKIYMLARRLYNVLLYLAQEQGWQRDVYQAQLCDVMGKAQISSHDLEPIKNHLRSLNSTQVEWHSPGSNEIQRWDVSNLIGHASVIEQGKGRHTLVEWSFPPNIKKELLDPERFAQISLRMQSALRTHAGLALFEICARYVNNPGGLTARHHWTWWRAVLTGTPDAEAGDTYRQYKYFKRDVIKRALAEVDSVTDLRLELVEHRLGKLIDDIQFRVLTHPQIKLPLSRQPEYDLSLVTEAMALGIGQPEAEVMVTAFGKEAFGAALAEFGPRIRNPRITIERPEQYLRAMLKKGGFAGKGRAGADEGLAEDAPTEDASRVTRDELVKRFQHERRETALALFRDQQSAERDDALAAFEQEVIDTGPPLLRQGYKRVGLDNRLARTEFTQWLAQRTWGEDWDQPSDKELLALATGEH